MPFIKNNILVKLFDDKLLICDLGITVKILSSFKTMFKQMSM